MSTRLADKSEICWLWVAHKHSKINNIHAMRDVMEMISTRSRRNGGRDLVEISTRSRPPTTHLPTTTLEIWSRPRPYIEVMGLRSGRDLDQTSTAPFPFPRFLSPKHDRGVFINLYRQVWVHIHMCGCLYTYMDAIHGSHGPNHLSVSISASKLASCRLEALPQLMPNGGALWVIPFMVLQ